MSYWNDELLTGINEIDNQHKELCEMSSKLFQSFMDENIDEHIFVSIKYFEKYTIEHFSLEEKLQHKINYPHIKEHVNEHTKFKKEIQNIKSEINKNGITPKIIKKFNDKIINWLVFHFRESDGKLTRFIKNEMNIKLENKNISDIINQ